MKEKNTSPRALDRDKQDCSSAKIDRHKHVMLLMKADNREKPVLGSYVHTEWHEDE